MSNNYELMFKELSDEKSAAKIRKRLEEVLSNSTIEGPVKLDIPTEILERILFTPISDDHYVFSFSDVNLYKKIDLTGVSFRNVSIGGVDFTGFTGVSINPNEVYGKNISLCKFSGVTFLDTMDVNEVIMYGTDFTGSINAVINMDNCTRKSTRKIKSFGHCNFCDVTFEGVIPSYMLTNDKFGGSHNAVIRFSLFQKKIENCDFADVEFEDWARDIEFTNCSFKGSRNAILRYVTPVKNMVGNDYCDVTFDGPFTVTGEVSNNSFKGSNNAIIFFDGVNLSGNNFSDVDFSEGNIVIRNTLSHNDFSGSKNANITFHGMYALPFGKDKKIIDLVSGNNFDGVSFIDGYEYFPYFRVVRDNCFKNSNGFIIKSNGVLEALIGNDLCGVSFVSSNQFEGVMCTNNNFIGSKDAVIHPVSVYLSDISGNNFTDATITGLFSACVYDENTSYNGKAISEYIKAEKQIDEEASKQASTIVDAFVKKFDNI